jgi:hypothetical protein
LVGPDVRRRPAPLLGRHVGRRAGRFRIQVVGRSGQAEIRDAHPTVVTNQDILRLEIAVDDACLVGGGESRPGGEVQVEHPLRPQLTRRLHGPQRLSAHEFHGEEDFLFKRPDVEDGDDVGMGEPRHGLGFGQQLVATSRAGGRTPEIGAQELEGDFPVQLRVIRAVHDAHAAPANWVEDDVARQVGASGQRFGRRLLVRLGAHQRPHEARDELPALVTGVQMGADGFSLVVARFLGQVERDPILVETGNGGRRLCREAHWAS